MTDTASDDTASPERRKDMARRVRFESDMRGVPLHLEVRRANYGRRLKPMFDGMLAAVALVVFSPLLIAVAIAIKLDNPGPVLFIQSRTGYLGRRFRLFKFRTMVVNAEELKAELRAHNIHALDSPDFKLADDPRVTRVGRFLRKTSIDELPNLWNVVRGDMALVGPRPTSFDASTYRMPHLPRLAVKPGLTGLWQVSGRANIDFDERAELDMRYIRSLSAKQDVELIVRTIGAVKKGDGAC